MKTRHQVLTAEGRDRLAAELEHLRAVRRPAVIQRLRQVREQGAGQTYGEYQEAKDEAGFVEGRIRELESLLAQAEIARGGPDGAVALGSKVRVVDEEKVEETYAIVGPAEADSRARRISLESPVGQALLGHRAGEMVEASTPSGRLRLQIVEVS